MMMMMMMMMSWLYECVAGAWRRSQSADERLSDQLDGVADQSARHVAQHSAQGRPARVQNRQVSQFSPLQQPIASLWLLMRCRRHFVKSNLLTVTGEGLTLTETVLAGCSCCFYTWGWKWNKAWQDGGLHSGAELNTLRRNPGQSHTGAKALTRYESLFMKSQNGMQNAELCLDIFAISLSWSYVLILVPKNCRGGRVSPPQRKTSRDNRVFRLTLPGSHAWELMHFYLKFEYKNECYYLILAHLLHLRICAISVSLLLLYYFHVKVY